MKILAELNTIGTEKSGKGVVKFFIHFFDPVFQGMGDWKPVDFPGHVVTGSKDLPSGIRRRIRLLVDRVCCNSVLVNGQNQ